MSRADPCLGVIVETRYLAQHMPSAVVDVLRARGCRVDIINPDDGYFAVEAEAFTDAAGRSFSLRDYDLIVSRNRNALGLVLLRYAEEIGIPVVNSHVAVQKVRNKARMAVTLALAGIRAAPTFIAATTQALAGQAEGKYPLILKNTYGDNCRGLQLVRNRDELAELNWDCEVVLAQSYFPTDGYDLKLYVSGGSVYAVRKPSPFNGDVNAPSQGVPVTAELAAMARKCGEVFGLDLYGVDCIETADGPVVIEVNDFPNYTGIPGVAAVVADRILECARRSGTPR